MNQKSYEYTQITPSYTSPEFDGQVARRLENGGFFLCQGGEAEIVLDAKPYRIGVGDLVVTFPFSTLQVLERSAAFRGILLCSDTDFFAALQIPNKFAHYCSIKQNPAIRLSSAEVEEILTLYRLFVSREGQLEHPFRAEVQAGLLRLIAYDIAALYLQRTPVVEQPQSRNELIFQHFIYALYSEDSIQRSVVYYAEAQAITPRHLSTVVKQVSGQTANEWITSCLLVRVKVKLQENELSINQISEAMEFPNPSFFAQYFKKYEGVTPKEFRHRCLTERRSL